MRPIFMIRQTENEREGNCHRVERQVFYERKLRHVVSYARVVNHPFPEFRKDILQEHDLTNMVNERRD